MKAIPTRYKGYHFRSRLEARWAVFFDALGLKWEYEPEGFELPDGTWYLPDFLVEKHWMEVKPPGGDISKAVEFAKTSERMVVILDGTPEVQAYHYIGTYSIDGVDIETYMDTLSFVPRSDKYFPFYYHYNYNDEREYPWSPDFEIEAACAAARSARFEHGQSGAA